jgi:tetratricopeptide (TPR) repeat protein
MRTDLQKTTAARRQLADQLALCDETGDRRGLVRCCFELGVLCVAGGEVDSGEPYLRRALVLSEAMGDTAVVASCYAKLGLVFELRGDLGQATFYFQEALGRFTETQDSQGRAETLGHLGLLQLQEGLLAAAEASHREALTLYQELSQPLGEAVARGNLAAVCAADGRLDEAEEMHQCALTAFRLHGDDGGASGQIRSLGLLALQRDEPETAQAHFREALVMATAAGYVLGQALSRMGLADLARDSAALPQAEELYEQALEEAKQSGHRALAATLHGSLGCVHHRLENYEAACTDFELALEVWDDLARLPELADTCKRLGDVYFRLDEDDAKTELTYERARATYESLGDEAGMGSACTGLGKVAARRGEASQAVGLWAMAVELLRKSGRVREAAEVERAMRSCWSQRSTRVA